MVVQSRKRRPPPRAVVAVKKVGVSEKSNEMGDGILWLPRWGSCHGVAVTDEVSPQRTLFLFPAKADVTVLFAYPALPPIIPTSRRLGGCLIRQPPAATFPKTRRVLGEGFIPSPRQRGTDVPTETPDRVSV